MKLVAVLSIFFSLSMYACPDFTGAYFCSKEAEDYEALQSRNFSLSLANNIWSLDAKFGTVDFPIGKWAELSYEDKDGVQIITYSRAKCGVDSMLLGVKADMNYGDLVMESTYKYILTKLDKDNINVEIRTDGSLHSKFDCKRL